jgi:hypothetical protein
MHSQDYMAIEINGYEPKEMDLVEEQVFNHSKYAIDIVPW